MRTKTCTRCKKEKKLTEFYEKVKNTGRYKSICKKCMSNNEPPTDDASEDERKADRRVAKYVKYHRQRKHLTIFHAANEAERLGFRLDHDRWEILEYGVTEISIRVRECDAITRVLGLPEGVLKQIAAGDRHFRQCNVCQEMKEIFEFRMLYGSSYANFYMKLCMPCERKLENNAPASV